MSDTAPTTVGTILAKLRMDRDQWVADVAKTKQDARELGNLRPDIHIDDNASTVIGRMAAAKTAVDAVSGSHDRLAGSQSRVTSAEGRLTAAMSAADSAYARANVAQMRLNELREKGVTSGARYASAELSLSEALKRLDNANDKVTTSELALAAARQANTVATENETRATIAANEANKTSVTRVGAIATAIALLVPLIAPVGAAAVGLGGAFLGMGAAGVAALFGINQEMKRGSDTGNAYRSGLTSLSATMNVLAQTAAVNMLASFRRAVADTNAALPMLNKQVGQFSALLGETGAAGLSGTISALRVLNPLFLTAGVYVRSLAEGFERWASGSGIEEFNGYALATFPKVVDVLGKLASMVMHILEALAPLGTIGLAVLTGVADAISSIPVDVLSQLIVTVTWGAVAFKAWGFIAPMLALITERLAYATGSVTALNAAVAIGTGPIGWVVAGLAALAGVLAVVIANNNNATEAMQNYTAAVDADNAAVGENVRAKAAQRLSDEGALAAARKLGANLQDVTNATLGHADALKNLSLYTRAADGDQDALNQIMQQTGMNTFEAINAINTMVGSMRSEADQISLTVEATRLRNESLTDTTAATKAQQWADEAAAGALGISVKALQEARAGQDGVTDSTAKATAEMYLQGDAAGLLRQKLDQLNGKALSYADSQNQLESQLVRFGKAIDDNGTSLEGMTEGAIANRGSILDLIQSAQNAAQAYRDQGAGSDEARQKLIDSKQAIEDQAVANGMNRDSVHAYLEELFKIPAEVPKTKIEVDTSTANAQLQAFLARVSSQVAWINVKATMPDLNGAVSGSGRPGVALGGTIPGLAGGGSGGTVDGPGTAGSDSAGLFRLAKGEEVISNVFGQADRNRALLKQINAGWTPPPAGYTPSPGGFAAPGQAAPAGPNIVHNVNNTFNITQNEDPVTIANVVNRKLETSLVRL